MPDYENLNLNTTTSSGINPVMQACLNRYIIKTAKPDLVYTKFGDVVDIPKGKTKVTHWQKMSPLPKATVPLTEGITPRGQKVHITDITGIPKQYGNYVSFTDQLDFFAHDPSPKVLDYAGLLGVNAAETLDSVAADELTSGTNVRYAGGVASRSAITAKLTLDDVFKAVRDLKRNNAKPINGDYIAIVHTDVAYDIRNDGQWTRPNEYQHTTELIKGEIGKIGGVRFIETSGGKVVYGTPFATIGGVDINELTVTKIDTTTMKLYVQETLVSSGTSGIPTSRFAPASSVNKKIIVNNVVFEVTGATAGADGEGYITLASSTTEAMMGVISPDMKVYAGDGQADGKPVYLTLVLGAHAYGTTGLNKTLETIAKGLGSAGTSDPLNQRGTMGWKAYHMTKRLVEEYMVRIESVSSAYDTVA